MVNKTEGSSQSRKITYCRILFYGLPSKGTSTGTESKLVVPGTGEISEWGVTANGYKVSSGSDENHSN